MKNGTVACHSLKAWLRWLVTEQRLVTWPQAITRWAMSLRKTWQLSKQVLAFNPMPVTLFNSPHIFL